MRKTMIAMVAVALTMAFAGVSSASAYQFSPETGASFEYHNAGTMRLKTQLPEWTCSDFTLTGKVTTGVITGKGPRISSCTGSNGGTVTFTSAPSAVWSVTATSPTTATLSIDTAPTSGGTVMSIVYGFAKATAVGPISIPNLPWNNTTHRLTLPATTRIPLQTSDPISGITFGTGINVEGTLQFPSNLTITP
jgi:hypothetical protein